MAKMSVEEVAEYLARIEDEKRRALLFLFGFGVGAAVVWWIARNAIEHQRDYAASERKLTEEAREELDRAQELHKVTEAELAAVLEKCAELQAKVEAKAGASEKAGPARVEFPG